MSNSNDPTPLITLAFAGSLTLHVGLISLFAYADPQPRRSTPGIAQTQLVFPLDPLVTAPQPVDKPKEPKPEPQPEPQPEPPPPPPPPQPKEVTAGIDDGTADTPNWLGFKDPTPHSAMLSTVEQSALSPAPGRPDPLGAPPSPPNSAAAETAQPAPPPKPEAIPDPKPDPTPEPKPVEKPPTPADQPSQPDPAAPNEEPGDAPPDEAIRPPEPPRAAPEPVAPKPEETPAPVENPPAPVEPRPAEVMPPPTPEKPLPAPIAETPAAPVTPDQAKPGPEQAGASDAVLPDQPAAIPAAPSAPDASLEKAENGILPEQLSELRAPPPSSSPPPQPPPAIVAAPPRLGPLTPEPLSSLSLDLTPALLTAPTPNATPTPAPSSRPLLSPGAPASGKGVGEKSDAQSDASAIAEALTLSPGRVEAHKGLRITTVRPEWSITTRMTITPRNPVVRVIFGRNGRVTKAEFVKGQSSGFDEVDGPLLDALYRWTASGEALNKLSPHDPLAGVTMSFRVLIRPDDPFATR